MTLTEVSDLTLLLPVSEESQPCRAALPASSPPPLETHHSYTLSFNQVAIDLGKGKFVGIGNVLIGKHLKCLEIGSEPNMA